MPYTRITSRLFTYVALTLAGSAFCHTAIAATACVWRVTNVPVPFYLVGTMHALASADYPLPEAYYQALHESKRLIFELKPDPKSDYPRKFAAAAVYPKGDYIQRHIHPKTWAILSRAYRGSSYFGKTFTMGDYYIDSIEKLRPWAVAYFIWGIRGYSDVYGEYGVDDYLAYQAKRFHKEVAGIESDNEHIAVLADFSEIESELTLVEAIVRGDKRRDDYNAARAAWKRGDIEALRAVDQRSRNLNPGADVRLLDERNVRWIPRIKAEMKTGVPTSLVVGAGHFMGPNGVVELLKRSGYKVEQL